MPIAPNTASSARGTDDRGGISLQQPRNGRADQRPSRQLQGCVATSGVEGRGSGGPPPRTRPAMRGRIRGDIIADERPGKEECGPPSSTRRQRLASLADGRGGMLQRTSGEEGEWTRPRGTVSYKTIWVAQNCVLMLCLVVRFEYSFNLNTF